MGSDADDASWRATGARFEGTWTAGKVARHLGIAESTLRSWHRRYGVGPHSGQPGRHRRYRVRDVARLEQMRDLIAAGVLPSDAAQAIRRSAGDWAEAADVLSALVTAAATDRGGVTHAGSLAEAVSAVAEIVGGTVRAQPDRRR